MCKVSVLTPTIRPVGLKTLQEGLEEQTFQDFEWLVEVGLPNKNGHDLNKAYNRMLRRAQGEIVVSVQDYIELQPDSIKMFCRAYEEGKRFCTAPVGKVKGINYGTNQIKWDWRKSGKVDIEFRDWEIDFACGSLSAIKDVGGFDEKMDGWWGFDNVNLAYRLSLHGEKFYNLPDNKAVVLDHNLFTKHPFSDKINKKMYAKR